MMVGHCLTPFCMWCGTTSHGLCTWAVVGVWTVTDGGDRGMVVVGRTEVRWHCWWWLCGWLINHMAMISAFVLNMEICAQTIPQVYKPPDCNVTLPLSLVFYSFQCIIYGGSSGHCHHHHSWLSLHGCLFVITTAIILLSLAHPCQLITLLAESVFIMVIIPLLSFIHIPVPAVLFLVLVPIVVVLPLIVGVILIVVSPSALSLWHPLTIFDVQPMSGCSQWWGSGRCWWQLSSSVPCCLSSSLGQVVPIISSHPSILLS